MGPKQRMSWDLWKYQEMKKLQDLGGMICPWSSSACITGPLFSLRAFVYSGVHTGGHTEAYADLELAGWNPDRSIVSLS